MSFGAHEYQHRFYRQVPHKKPAFYTPPDNSVLPLLSEQQKYPLESYQTSAYPSPMLTRTPIQQYQMVSPQRIRTEPTSELEQQYIYNSAILDRFKKEAEEYKHKIRFRHLRRDSEQLDKYQSIQYNNRNDQPQPRALIYNPEVLAVPLNYDSRVLERLDHYEQEQKMILKHLERENNQSKYKLKDYKRKYSRLKDKLRKELEEKREEETRRTIEKEQQQIQKEKNRLSQIRKMMSSISENLNKNSELLNQSIKLHQDLKIKNSFYHQKKSSLSCPKDPSQHLLQTHERTMTECDQEQSPPHSPPTVVYTKKSVDFQFDQMQKVKKDIQKVKYRLKKINA